MNDQRERPVNEHRKLSERDVAPGAHASGSPSRTPEEQNLELRQLLTRFITVCNAIAYAHSRGVLHRNLKPSNIMLGEFGETLVVDWGLARVQAAPEQEATSDGSTIAHHPPLLGSDSDLTHAGQALGTPAHMSPEQAAGRMDQLGPASDIYSLGATLYHLVAGQAPFGKSAIGEVLKQVQRGEFSAPRQVNRQAPAALEAICLKAMALQPRDRYSSAKALAADLEHWLADEAVTAYAEPLPARVGRWMRHHKGLVGSAAAMFAVALTMGIAGWMLTEAKVREKTEQALRGVAEEKQVEAENQTAEAEKQKGEAHRNGKYADALKILNQADKFNSARFKRSLPGNLAFIAMTQFQLGQKAEAVATLGKLRELMKKLPSDRYAEDLLKEAESVVEAKR